MAMQCAMGLLGWTPGPWEVVLILVVVLLLFGGRKLPELAKGLGKGLRLFKKEIRGVKDELESVVDAEIEDKASETPADNKLPDKTVNSANNSKSAEDDSDKQ